MHPMRVQNPFPYLVRDSDVEGMSDGFDNGTAYGACPCMCHVLERECTTITRLRSA